MATTPDIDVVDHIDTALGTLTKGTNLFAGPVRGHDVPDAGVPDEAVFVLATGGPAPLAFIAGGSGTEQRFSSLLIRVRSDPNDFQGGQTLARSVRDAIHHSIPTGYIEAAVRETDPSYLGVTNKGHHEWSIGVDLMHLQ